MSKASHREKLYSLSPLGGAKKTETTHRNVEMTERKRINRKKQREDLLAASGRWLLPLSDICTQNSQKHTQIFTLMYKYRLLIATLKLSHDSPEYSDSIM